MEKAVETTNVSGETTIIDLGKEISIQGGVEMNNATPLEGSSVILGEQDIVHNGDDQASNSEDVEWIDDGEVMEIIQKLKMVSQIHPSNLAGNT
jgi:hypothetical protein